MPHDGQTIDHRADLLALTETAMVEVDGLFQTARESLRTHVTVAGKVSAKALEQHQFAAHTLAWLATYAQALRQMQAWAVRLHDAEDRKSTRLNSSHLDLSRMPSSA